MISHYPSSVNVKNLKLFKKVYLFIVWSVSVILVKFVIFWVGRIKYILLMGFYYLFQQQFSHMPKNSNKIVNSIMKNSPFNINISFNINPKNIVHPQKHHQASNPQNIIPDSFQKNGKNKVNKVKKYNDEYKTSDCINKFKKKNVEAQYMNLELSQKQIEKLKKNFLNQIIDIDIPLAQAALEGQHEIHEQKQEDKSSVMSARMQKYGAEDPKITPNLNQFNRNNPNEKYEAFGQHQMSKVLPVMNFKKGKSQFKQFGDAQQSKYLTHKKGFSTFTEVKHNISKEGRKKGKYSVSQIKKTVKNKQVKVKQQNLKEKLQKFKVDMMRLVSMYDENELLKTKFSSSYNNIRSREMSKDMELLDINKLNQAQKHEKMSQIKEYQQNRQLQPVESQQFNHLKDIYEVYSKKKYEEQRVEQEKIQTDKIIQYYKEITYENQDGEHSDNYNGNIVYRNSDINQQNMDSSISSSKYSNPQLKSQPKTPKSIGQEQSNNNRNLYEFVQFIQKKIRQQRVSEQLGINFTKMVDEFLQGKHNQGQDCIVYLQSSDNQKKSLQSRAIDSNINELDDQINKQLEIIPHMRDHLSEKMIIDGQDAYELQLWEQKYKKQLISMKGNMWKQYKKIQNIVQSRIISSENYKPIETIKTKKQKLIMKCLSENILKNKFFSNYGQSIRNYVLKNDDKLSKNTVHQKYSQFALSKQSNLSVNIEHLQVQYSQSDSHSQDHQVLQISDIRSSFFSPEHKIYDANSPNKQSPQGQSHFLIDKLIKVQQSLDHDNFDNKFIKSSLLQDNIFKTLNNDDKQDIFEFIFLDLCIEIYQQYLQMENQSKNNYQQIATAGNARILKSLKDFIIFNKKIKKAENQKKIGFSTNVNSIKSALFEMKSFLLSDTRINESPLTNKQKIMHKLNNSLGPSEIQILKSLRLSIFDNQPVDYQQVDADDQDYLILEPELFNYYENQVLKIQTVEFPAFFEDEKREIQRVQFLRNCLHIHQKALFDCLNQNLDSQRIFGLWGKPFIWKQKPNFYHEIQQKDIEISINNAFSETIKCATFVCGLMVHKQDSLIKDIAADPNYVRKLQDERIYKLLEKHVVEMQQKWYFHDDEYTQILVEISHIIWTILLKECIKQLVILKN